MNSNARSCPAAAKFWQPLLLALCLALGACANTTPRPPRYDGAGPLPPLAYYQLISRMSLAELGRERSVLAALPSTPNSQLRTAMLFGHPRAQPQELGKAIGLLDGILKLNEPAAVSLHPLARLLADNYLERQKQETQMERQSAQIERQAGQLNASQRKAAELQEKLDGLADIERTLPQRSRATRPAAGGGAR